MKKSKILVLVAALLVTVMTLTACGGSVALTDYINPDYDTSAEVITTAEKISALKDYTYVEDNGYIAVFSMIDEEDVTKVTYKLVNLADASVVATLSKANTTFDFTAYGPTYLVTKVTTPEADPEAEKLPESKTEYVLYDVTGTAVASSKYFDTAKVVSRDYIVYDRAIYEINAKGALTKMADVPEYVSIDFDDISDEYFYVSDDNSVVVYDREFNYVSFFEAPDYAEGFNSFLLDNGDYLVQYYVQLDNNAKKYDVYDSATIRSFRGEEAYENVTGLAIKYDLVTLLVSAEDGSAKELKLNCVIEEIETNSYLYDAEEENNMYIEDSFENIVIYYPIEDGKVNYADSAAEICFMDNKGKIGDSLKLFDDMLAYGTPRKIAEDLYYAYGATGVVLLNGEGEIIKRVTDMSSLRLVGNYWLGEYAIYSADLSTVVYDLLDNEVEDYEIVGDSIFMEIELDDDEYKVVLFANGEAKAIYNSETMGEDKSFDLVDDIGGYYIYDQAEDQYTYYSANGTKILTTKAKATFIANGEDTVLASVTVEGETTYYLFK